jgi:hypothetical protein
VLRTIYANIIAESSHVPQGTVQLVLGPQLYRPQLYSWTGGAAEIRGFGVREMSGQLIERLHCVLQPFPLR